MKTKTQPRKTGKQTPFRVFALTAHDLPLVAGGGHGLRDEDDRKH